MGETSALSPPPSSSTPRHSSSTTQPKLTLQVSCDPHRNCTDLRVSSQWHSRLTLVHPDSLCLTNTFTKTSKKHDITLLWNWCLEVITETSKLWLYCWNQYHWQFYSFISLKNDFCTVHIKCLGSSSHVSCVTYLQEANCKTHKASKVLILGNIKMLLTSGTSRWNDRQIALWDQVRATIWDKCNRALWKSLFLFCV